MASVQKQIISSYFEMGMSTRNSPNIQVLIKTTYIKNVPEMKSFITANWNVIFERFSEGINSKYNNRKEENKINYIDIDKLKVSDPKNPPGNDSIDLDRIMEKYNMF